MIYRSWKLTALIIGMVAFLMPLSFLMAQESEEAAPEAENAQDVLPTAPDEEPIESAKGVDLKEIMTKALERIGGTEGLEKVKDLVYIYEHKNYLKGEKLYFKEHAEGFVRPGRFFKERLDFKSYVKTSSLKQFHDYREVIGDDGEFKYIDGRLLTGPDVVMEAGDRLTATYFQLFGLWDVMRNLDQMTYLGQVQWTDPSVEEEVVRTCHKILVPYDRDRMLIRDAKIALYIDTDTYEFRRYVCEPIGTGTAQLQRTRIVNLVQWVDLDGIKLPTYLFIVDMWGDRLNCTHDVYYEDFVLNSGLEGIGFEMTNQ